MTTFSRFGCFSVMRPTLSLAIALAIPLASGSIWAQQAPAIVGQPHIGQPAPSQANQANAKTAPATQPNPASEAPNRASAYYHFALAHIYEDLAANYGQPSYATHAIEQYKMALDADQDSEYLNAGLAKLYLQTGRVRDAIVAAQNTLKTQPDNLEAHKLLGRVYLQTLGNMQSDSTSEHMLKLAIDEYVKIVQLAPKDVESRLLLGQLYTLDHNTAAATTQFEAARQIDPNSEDVVLNLARIYNDSGQQSHTVTLLQSVPEADRTAKIEYALGTTYEQLKQNDNAIQAYQKALELAPENLNVERSLAQALLKAGKTDQALKYFQAITEANPQDAASYLRISEIERQQGHYHRAMDALEKAKSLASGSLEIQFNEALLNDSLGNYDKAAATLKGLADQTRKPNGHYTKAESNNRAIFLDRLASVYREQSKTDDAIAAYREMIAMGGDAAEQGYQGQVDTYREAGEFSQATSAAEEAAKAMPNDLSVQLMLAGQLADTGEAKRGIALAKSQLKGNADDREVEMSLAQIYTRLRRWKDAGDSLDKAEALSKTDQQKTYVDFLRGALAEQQKQYDVAEKQFRKVLAANPDSAMTLNYLGYMLAEQGVKLPDALTLIQKAVKLDPNNGAYLDSLGWVYFKMGQYTLAEVNLHKAVDRMSHDPTVHDHLGELYARTGRLKLAAAEWEKSLEAYSKSPHGDAEPGEMSKVKKKLDNARMRLAKEEKKQP